MVLAAILAGCSDDDGLSHRGPITIRLVSENLEPVTLAYVEGGVDWTQFIAVPDDKGYVHVPGFSVNWDTRILAANHFPVTVRPRPYQIIELEKTAAELVLIGHSDVFPVRFTRDTLIHLDYNGDLVTFLYDESGMTEVSRVGLARLRRSAVLTGDTLWYTTHSGGVYSYDISDPANPNFLRHLEVEGYLGALEVSDNLLFVGQSGDFEGIGIYNMFNDGEPVRIGEWSRRGVKEIRRKGNALILLGGLESDLTVLSIVNPAEPTVVFEWSNPYYASVSRYGDSIVFGAAVELYPEHYANLVLDISDPMVPRWREPFNSQAYLLARLNDTLCGGALVDQPVLMSKVGETSYWTTAIALSSYHLQWFSDERPREVMETMESWKPGFFPWSTVPPQLVGRFVILDSRLWMVAENQT